MSDFQTESTPPPARKVHKCGECHGHIAPGVHIAMDLNTSEAQSMSRNANAKINHL
ncbi:hypothetical protein D9M71_646900 [compost metagenome]